jgi:phosphopantothenoylcysteine decarboxylase / phosphopantothenate---cysteine ligase
LKKTILGVTGGIAAYKAVELARLLIREGSDVQVVMTRSATCFVAPLTFQTLTGQPVYTEMFAARRDSSIAHIELLNQVDLFVVAPATANTIAKMAHGLADNLLTTLYLAAQCPVVIVPSMNVNMYEHQTVVENIQRLTARGCLVMDPDLGELACGVYGKGRMPEPAAILEFVKSSVVPSDFSGIRALVTAGPTREPIDPVRFISNPSSGLMGYSVARALQLRGAEVILISGPTSLVPPAGVKLISVTTAEQMYSAVLKHYNNCKLVVKTAAVSDFKPQCYNEQKVKKAQAGLTLAFVPTPDILLELGKRKQEQVLVGFAAETENAEQNAGEKLISKNLDLIVLNNLVEEGAGFASRTNRVTIINRNGKKEQLPLMEKEQLAHELLNRIAPLL